MGSNENIADNVAVRLPNGKIQVTKSSNPSIVGRIFESEEEMKNMFPVNESGEASSSIILDSING